MDHRNHEDNKRDKSIREDEMSVDSFTLYQSTSGKPKIVDGEKIINSFDIYPEEDSDTDRRHK